MTRKPPATPQQVWELFLRRKGWILAPVVALPLLVGAVSPLLPKQYESETIILVDPQKIPVEYVKAAVASDITDRLQTIKEEVMSRTRLQLIADQLELYPAVRQGKKNDDARDKVIAAMQRDMTVTLIKGTSDHNAINGFKIEYLAAAPQLAQKVTQRIADLFIQQNLKARAQDAQGTNEFINDALAKARTALSEQEEKIKIFKAAHMGSLPEQEASNLTLISQYQSLAQANSEGIDRANQQRVYLESMLNGSATTGSTQKSAPLEVQPLQLEINQKEAELAADQQKYTDAYPDVIRLKTEISQLRQEQSNAPRSTAQHPIPAPVSASGPSISRQLEGQLAATQQEIALRTARQQDIENHMRSLQDHISMLPATQQEFEDLSRDYQAMQLNYASLQEKQQASGMATELERHNDSESFRILDPASLPSDPSSPNLLMINGGGLLAAIVLGLGLGVLIDMRDATIHNPEELESYVNLPLIVAVPSFSTELGGMLVPPRQSRFGSGFKPGPSRI